MVKENGDDIGKEKGEDIGHYHTQSNWVIDYSMHILESKVQGLCIGLCIVGAAHPCCYDTCRTLLQTKSGSDRSQGDCLTKYCMLLIS